jgi:hypothetical protein
VAGADRETEARIAEMKKGGHSAAGTIILLREMEVSNSMRHEQKVIEHRIERLTRATELVP